MDTVYGNVLDLVVRFALSLKRRTKRALDVMCELFLHLTYGICVKYR